MEHDPIDDRAWRESGFAYGALERVSESPYAGSAGWNTRATLAEEPSYKLNPMFYHLDPLWDPIRDHPRFPALLEKAE